MNLPVSESSLLLCACAVLPFLFCRVLPAQGPAQADAEVKALVAKIDAARGKPSRQPLALTIEGTFVVTFEGAPEPVAQGKFHDYFLGTDRARHTSEMGEHGAMERGVDGDLVWEADPAMGAKVHAGAKAETVRRHLAMVRGTSPSELYKKIEHAGRQDLDGKPHEVLRMSFAASKPDVWYVDAATGNVSRIDTVLPAPESADATWDMGDWVATQLTFGDWRRVDGVQYPHKRSLKMGPATVAFTCTRITADPAPEPACFTPPDAVRKAEALARKQPAADGKAPWQIVERQAQPVASIRLRCKATDISATLAVVLPEVMAHINATGAKMAGAPFSRYHGELGAEIDLEAGIPVARPIVEKGRVVNSELPAGKAVTFWHIGAYDKLTAAHQALQEHVAANKLKVRGGPWEVYWTDPGMVPDQAKWRTQLFQPIEQ